jgi:hypothetical protein
MIAGSVSATREAIRISNLVYEVAIGNGAAFHKGREFSSRTIAQR